MRLRHGLAIAAAALWLAPLAARAAAPEIETRASETQVAKGQPIELHLRLRGEAAAHQPDFAPLAADFDVLDVQRSQRMVVRGGVSDTSVDWLVALAPRRSGALEIPALTVGDTASEPLAIEVGAAGPRANAPSAAGRAADPADAEPDDAASVSEPVRLEVHVAREQPYEHERVLLRVELTATGEITDGALTAPEIPGAVIEPLGEDRRIEKEVDGRRYHGIERDYTVLFEDGGEYELAPIRFEGRLRMPQTAPRSRGFFGRSMLDDFFAQGPPGNDLLENFFGVGGRRVAVESQPLALRVQPRPTEAAGSWWLPARDVTLSELWHPDGGPVRVGEPITRRIELRADGASPAQLPPLPAPEVAGVKQYAEAPKTSETARGSVRVEQTTLIPTQPGSLTLPAIEVAWWDTQTDAARSATLPARTLEVLPAAAGGDTPAGAGAPARASEPAAPALAAPAPAPVAEAGSIPPTPDPRLLAGVLALAVGALSLLGVVVVARRRRGATPSGEPLSRRAAERALSRACRRGDPAAAEAALRALGRALAPGSHGWQGTRWAEALGVPALAQEIARLQSLRYLSEAGSWQGAKLWRAWRSARKLRRPARLGRELPPLYEAPESTRG